MNDFTKDELELIHDGLAYAAGASLETGGEIAILLIPIAKKIQSMIDKYCEHKNAYQFTSFRLKCDDCGMIY